MQTKKSKTKPKSVQTTATQAPPTTAPADTKLIAGAKISRKALRYQATKTAEGYVLYQQQLTKKGCPAGASEAIIAAREEFDALAADKVAAKQATLAYYAAVAKGVDFRDELAVVIKAAARNQPEVLVANPLRLTKARTGYAVAQWFNEVHGVMEILRADLAKIPSVDWFAELSAQETALNAAIGVYEQHVAQRKARADKRTTAQNKLVKLIQEVHSFAAIAFRGNKAVLAQFKLTADHKKTAKAKTTGPAGGSSPTQPAGQGSSTQSNASSTQAASPAQGALAAPPGQPGQTENAGTALVAAPTAPPAPVQPSAVAQHERV